jgi:GT2 family glycosyltransferase
MEPSSSAPPVVAVVVTCDPGPWLEETLASLAAQDYPNLSVLVIDAASTVDPTSRVAAVLPDSFVRRLDQRVGFGQAVNEVIGVVEGASHFIFCHDDVAPSPDAFRLLVEEAFRSNAGIVTPKVVEWDQPDRLISVGAGADRLGVVHPLVERGELDQEQHDRVRDVFVAPSGVTLVRADLFSTLDGYSPEIDQFGEDLDLSWRAQVAGARVVVAPAARVRHLEAELHGLRVGWTSSIVRRRGEARADAHRLRTLAVCSGPLRVPWILPLALVASVFEAIGQLVTGRASDAGFTLWATFDAFRRPLKLLSSRRATQKHRHAADRQLARRQSQGSARFRGFVRSRLQDGPSGALPLAPNPADPLPSRPRRTVRGLAMAPALEVATGDDRAPGGSGAPAAGTTGVEAEVVNVGGGSWRNPLVVGGLLLVLAIIGSRGLLGHELPAIGSIPVTAGGVSAWWREWWSTWQGGLLGAQGTSPPGLGLLAVAGSVFFGAVDVLQRVLVLAPLIVGPFGAYRAARWWGSLRGRVAALIVYALVPVPYNALAHGDWPALLAYAGAPWVLSMIVRLSDQLPFPPTTARGVIGRTVGIGVVVALVAAFVPSWLLVVPMIGVALALGSLLVGQSGTAARTLTVSIGSAVVAAVLLAPWSIGVLHSRVAMFGVKVGPSGRLGFGQVLRMHTGPIGTQPLGWALLAAAALPLAIGRSWRLAWAARLWMVALASFGLVWAGSRGWVPTPPPEDVLAFAAAALAGSVALGAVAFELDLPGYRFGWRQLASGVAAIAVIVAGVPTMIAAGNGRWDLPNADATSVLGFLPGSSGGDYRVLWLGAPAGLPMASQYLADGVAYATSFDGEPNEADQWTPPRTSGSTVMAVDLRRATLGLTTQLGHLLAPYAVRYIIVPNHDGPAGSGAEATPVGASVLAGLATQTDLASVSSDANYTVYSNAAWAPVRAVVSASLDPVLRASQARQSVLLGQTDVGGASRPVLTGGQLDHVTGPVSGGTTIAVSSSRSDSWSLRVDGRKISSSPAYGWAMSFNVPTGTSGTATLSAGTSLGPRVGQIVELALWGVALAVLIGDRRRRVDGTPELVQPEWFVPLTVHRRFRTRAGSRSGLAAGDSDLDSDELWIDV